jgi:hypothetical protein
MSDDYKIEDEDETFFEFTKRIEEDVKRWSRILKDSDLEIFIIIEKE